MAKILIVDDEPLITTLIEDWLSELGHEVIGPAHNLAKALALADSDIDAAIVDVTLGKENSYPLVDALNGRDVPLALATGHGQDGIDPRYRGQSTLRKPFDFATFRRTLDELLEQSRPGRASRRPRRYLSDWLIAPSAFDPGHSSRSDSSLSGRSVVPKISCSSLASSSM